MQKKKTLSHQKMKCSVLDYVQLLMISWVIWVTNINRNKKKNKKRPPNSSKNKMPIFGLCSTSDDQLSDLNDERQLKQKKKKKTKKGPPNSLKNKMLIFGLCSTSNDLPSNLSDEHQPKCRKMKKGPLCHQKIKCSFLDYVQLLMIGQVISAMNIDQKATKWKKAPNVIEK